MTFWNDVQFAARSLRHSKGLTATVVLTLALGIGANAAIFSLVRGVLLRPLVNRDEDRLIYIRQSARGIGADNAAFSVPELEDLRARVHSFTAFGDFSTIGFTMLGLGEPRSVRAGVVGGSYFDVMGLRPVLGRLLDQRDDGPKAAGAAVLTYRFWTTALGSDPGVIGKVIRLGSRSATVVGVLEPAVPYPAETEIIANVVTSPHHLSATMVTGRVHRMTELFGRLAPGTTLEQARAELQTAHGTMIREHAESYPKQGDFRIEAVRLREQLTSRARTVLLVLLGAAGLVFLIACSNVANLILARTVRREGELTVRAALGASRWALRRTLLAESLLLCGAGALLGLLAARPAVAVLAKYASRFSVRALEVSVDASLLAVGVGLALGAAVVLAFVPRLPSEGGKHGTLAASSVRVTGSANRRLRMFAVAQIACSFVLLAGASALLETLLRLQAAETGYDVHRVLVMNVPVMSFGRTPEQISAFYRETVRKVRELPGVDGVAVGSSAPWRDAGNFGPGFQFTAEGYARGAGEEDPRGRMRIVSAGFFPALGIPLLAGREFNESDRQGGEPVVVVSQSLAQRMFPNQDAVNRHISWTDPVMRFVGIDTGPRRIVGIVNDVDDENVVPGPALTIYHPTEQMEMWGGRLFIHAQSDPRGLIEPVTRLIHGLSSDQPVERPATLADIRAEVLTPDRLNTVVFGGFALVALAIAIVGVAGVLVFSVSGRTREFGIRLAIGSEPRHLVRGVLLEGAAMAAIGLAVGALAGYAMMRVAANYVAEMTMPGLPPLIGASFVLCGAAVAAAVWPALRAARVDVMQALRQE